MGTSTLFAGLHGLAKKGDNAWVARCPAHEDKTPSLSIKLESDGRILVHCFGGCAVEEVLAAAGCTFDDLFPPRSPGNKPALRWPFIPEQTMEIALHEIRTVAVIASGVYHRKMLKKIDYDRLQVAIERMNDVANSSYAIEYKPKKRKQKEVRNDPAI